MVATSGHREGATKTDAIPEITRAAHYHIPTSYVTTWPVATYLGRPRHGKCRRSPCRAHRWYIHIGVIMTPYQVQIGLHPSTQIRISRTFVIDPRHVATGAPPPAAFSTLGGFTVGAGGFSGAGRYAPILISVVCAICLRHSLAQWYVRYVSAIVSPMAQNGANVTISPNFFRALRAR